MLKTGPGGFGKWVVGPTADTPAIVTTEAIDETTQSEWKEDLNVMEKLLRDKLSQVSDGGSAMGIKLMMLGRASPIYVEWCGAIFSASVNFPLAPAGKGSATREARPRDQASAWERARRELKGENSPVQGQPPPAFEQAKVDELIDAIVKVLPEATNFRHLKPDEFVFVTVAGVDEDAQPVRLTLKAKKVDIDAAAGGKITAEEFAKRVARRIG